MALYDYGYYLQNQDSYFTQLFMISILFIF